MRDLLDRPARSFMTRQFVVVDEKTDVASAVRLMNSQKAESIIVSKRGLAVGIITDSDIIDKVVMKGEDSDDVLVSQVMSTPVVTVPSTATVKKALQEMRIHRVKRVPIAGKEGVIGIVTQASLAGAIRTSVLERTIKRARSTLQAQYKPVLGNLGVLLQFSAVLLVVPALAGTLWGEAGSITGIYLEVVGLSFAGFFLMSYGERGQMSLMQASIFVVVSFVVMSLFGSLPYIYLNPFGAGSEASSIFVNSLFESASGFTTTGLSMITTPEDLPKSFSFYRAYTQWVGGLSFVYLVMMLFFPEEKLSAMKSALGGGMLKFKEFIVTLVGIFSAYTIVLVFLTTISGRTDDVNSISLVFSAITGGGFVPTSTIVNGANLEVLVLTSGGMILSALPFAFHFFLFSKRGLLTKKSLGSEVVVYLIGMGLAVPLLYILLGGGPVQNIGTAAYHAISASTNTGFQYISMETISDGAKAFIIIMMLVGGCAFSTAGGIKVGRFLILYQEVSKRIGKKPKEDPSTLASSQRTYTSISATANPQRSEENRDFFEQVREEYRTRGLSELVQKRDELIKIAREVLAVRLVREILLVIGLYILVSFVTGAVLSNLTGRSFEDGLFESVSALTTTGLSNGITSLQLDPFSKLMLTANMILGRFEIIAILYIFFRALRR
ncbi:MAG TPA: potassium transporter TrkG [Nitrososphaera sp.]|nr:potassium transporter TrkG [Nitrososphaera sp.]